MTATAEASGDVPADGPKPRLLFDVTGLVAWYAFYRTPTGIQRVTERILMAPDIALNARVVFVARVPGAESLFVMDRATILGLGSKSTHDASIGLIRRAYVDMLKRVPFLPSVREMEWFQWKYFARTWLGLGFLLDSHRPSAPDPSYAAPALLQDANDRDVFVNLGDFWWYPRQSEAIGRLKARYGFRLVQMIHDLFPLGGTAWEPPAFRRKFIEQFVGLVPIVDGWLVNSVFVHDQLRHHLEQAGRPSDSIEVVPMGWDIPAPAGSAVAERDRVLLRGFGLEEGGYFLQVGTFEPRKNHMAVVHAVERLRKEHAASLPACVFTGVNGWRSGPLVRHLEQTQFAAGKIRWLKGVGDLELAALYRGALFTVYPSLMEGWGLPVQESLSYGVPCIASNAGAIPEAGLDLAVYVDPYDGDRLTDAIARYLTDPAALAEARSRIAAFLARGRNLPGWSDAAQTVLRMAEHGAPARAARAGRHGS